MIRLLGAGWCGEITFFLLLLASAWFSYGAYALGASRDPKEKWLSPGQVLSAYGIMAVLVLLLCRGLFSYFGG